MHDDHTYLEEELRRSLRRPAALPEGFADRVVQAAASQRRSTALPQRVWAAAAAALLVASLLGFGEGYWQGHEARRRMRAIQAAQEFATAMQITGSTLRNVGRDLDMQLKQIQTQKDEGGLQ